MSRNIPFFEFFAELSAASELRLRLAGAELTHGRIDQGDLSIQLDMTVKSPLAPEALHSLEESSTFALSTLVTFFLRFLAISKPFMAILRISFSS